MTGEEQTAATIIGLRLMMAGDSDEERSELVDFLMKQDKFMIVTSLVGLAEAFKEVRQ